MPVLKDKLAIDMIATRKPLLKLFKACKFFSNDAVVVFLIVEGFTKVFDSLNSLLDQHFEVLLLLNSYLLDDEALRWQSKYFSKSFFL